MKIINVELDKLTGYERNAKSHPPEQIEKLSQSIKKYGFTQPLVIDDKNVIIVGHGRHAAAKLAGLDKVPCVKLSGLSDEEVRAMRIFDNKINESSWDFSLLSSEIQDLNAAGFDLFETGFVRFEIDSFLSANFTNGIDVSEQTESAETPTDTQSKPADAPVSEGFKQVQLLMKPEQYKVFLSACKKLGEEKGTQNITDTVYKVLVHTAFGELQDAQDDSKTTSD